MLDCLPQPILDAAEWYGVDNLKVLAVVVAFWATVFFGWPLAKGSARLGWRALSWPFRPSPQDPLLARVLADVAEADAAWEASANHLVAGEVDLTLGVSWRAGDSALPSDLVSLKLGGADALDDLSADERRLVAKAAIARVRECEREAKDNKRALHLTRMEGGAAAEKPAKPPLRGGTNSQPQKLG